jgi:hypothetical protein
LGEIDGFNSPGAYRRFCTSIERQVASGDALERTADPNYGRGMISGGRWFEDRGTKQIWRLVPPDFPFRGLWEKVDLNAD